MARNPYVRDVNPTTWWVKDPHFNRRLYADYMASEATCVFVALYVAMLVWGLGALASGPEAYAAFLATIQSPVGVVLQLVALLFVIYHSVTWFQLAPKGMKALRYKGKKVPDRTVVLVQYVAWIGFSAAALIFAAVL